jgi:hypothetical protein
VIFSRGVAVLALAVCVEGCASTTKSDRGAPSGSRSDAAVPTDARENRLVRLTLQPIYDWQESETGYGDPVSIDGVRVCVARVRPWGGTWRDFRETAGPCTTSIANERVVLKGVPGVSELVVTASKEGYVPSAFAVTTDRWDLDTTVGGFPGPFLRIRRGDAPWASLPAREVISGAGGGVEVKAMVCRGLTCSFAGRARIAINPPVGEGPFYTVDGRLEPAATRTRGGGTSPAPFVAGGQGASFANVPEGEYRLSVDLQGTSCRAWGWFSGDPVWGFSSRTVDVIGVPVLAGHLTPNIWAQCTCDWQSRLDRDAGTCAAGPDASAPL